jgi:hypothetical protein
MLRIVGTMLPIVRTMPPYYYWYSNLTLVLFTTVEPKAGTVAGQCAWLCPRFQVRPPAYSA